MIRTMIVKSRRNPVRLSSRPEAGSRLADGPDHIIPGHDPGVTRRLPPLPDDSQTLQLHLEPRE